MIGLSTVLFVIGTATAAPDPVEVLTLDQCLAIAQERSPLMHSSQALNQAAVARIRQARALPNPVIDYDSDLQPKPFRFSQQGESYLGLSQTLELPWKRGVRGRIAEREADGVRAEGDAVRLSLAFEVKEAFSGLLLAKEKLDYARQNHELAQQFLDHTEAKLAAGDVARVELLRAQVEAATAANTARVAENQARLARARLAFLLARPPESPFEIEGQLGRGAVPPDLEPLLVRAVEGRPEIRQLEIGVARERLLEKQANLDYLPDIDVGVARHRIVGEESSWDVTVSVPIPLFFWQTRRGPVAEARANRTALEREAEHVRNGVRLEVEEAHTNAVSARERIQLIEKQILAQAEEVHEMFLFSYQEGEIGGIELIEARRTLIEARESYADALFDFDVALAALDKAVGE